MHRSRPLYAAYVAALLVGLAFLQARAFVQQIAGGYVPFVKAPVRIPYSWDMFAIRLDRCAIRWEPALEIEGRRVGAWRDRAYPLEFDTIFNRAVDYAWAARRGCAYRTAPDTEARVWCARSDGTVSDERFACPPAREGASR